MNRGTTRVRVTRGRIGAGAVMLVCLLAWLIPAVLADTAGSSTTSCADAISPPRTHPGSAEAGDALNIKSFTLSSKQDASLKRWAVITMDLAADPVPPPNSAATWIVEWQSGTTFYYAAYQVDQLRTDDPTKNVDPANPGLPKPVESWSLGTVTNNVDQTYTPDSGTDVDALQKSSSVDHTAHRITFRFPYGKHANEGFVISSSSAITYASAQGVFVRAPAPIMINPGNTGHSTAWYPEDNLAGGIGQPFCGDSAVTVGLQPQPTPVPGEVTLLNESMPNPAFTWDRKASENMRLFLDPTNDLAIGYSLFNSTYPACPDPAGTGHISTVAIDLHDYHVAAQGCPAIIAQAESRSGPGDSIGMFAADPVDHVFFSGSSVSSDGVAAQATHVSKLAIVSERDLTVIGTIDLPVGANFRTTTQDATGQFRGGLQGLHWDAAHHQLLVQYGGGDSPVTLVSYAVGRDAHGAIATSQNWSTGVSACVKGISQDVFGEYQPVRSTISPNIYLGCVLSSPVAGGQPETNQTGVTGVVKVQMTSACAAPAITDCPTGAETATAVPEPSSDFRFDPGSDRGFWIVNGTGTSQTGVDILVYDGASTSFLGRSATGSPNDSIGNMSLGLDAATGRFYAAAFGSGLTLIDGRRTPVPPAIQVPGLNRKSWPGWMPVVPPDSSHPYTRLLVALVQQDDSLPAFSVFADETPVGTDADQSLVDANTYTGPINPGDAVYTTYTADARGYGFHSDFVGSTDTALANNLGNGFQAGQYQGQAAFGPGNRDLLGATIDSLNLSDGSPIGTASALLPADDSTARSYAACTDVQAPSSCLSAFSSAPSSCAPSGGSPSPSASPGPCAPTPPPSAQLWPFLSANCANPATPYSPERQQQNGFNLTNYAAPSPSASAAPSQSAQSTSASNVMAATDCNPLDPKGGATGIAQLTGLQLGNNGLSGTSITVADAASVSRVSPPGSSAGAVGTVSSTARGISIKIPGQGTLTIGSVTQKAAAWAAGRPGTASTVVNLVIADVVIYDANGAVAQVICRGVCTDDQSMAQQVNQHFPALISLAVPTPDIPFKSAQDPNGTVSNPKAANFGSPQGSPGGYTALVQANPVERYGDHQFNGMSVAEATYLPGLRITVIDDGSQGLSREVLDLAGVQADAALGISDFPPPPPAVVPTPTATDTGNGGTPAVPPHCVFASPSPSANPSPTATATTAAVRSSAPGRLTRTTQASPSPSASPADPCTVVTVVPGHPGTAAIPARPGTPVVHHVVRLPGHGAQHHLPFKLASATAPIASAANSVLAGLVPGLNVLEKLFQGFGIHWRDIRSLLVIFAFLTVLVAPLILMMRRQLWLGSVKPDANEFN